MEYPPRSSLADAFLDFRRHGRFNPLFTIARDVRLRVILFRRSGKGALRPVPENTRQ